MSGEPIVDIADVVPQAVRVRADEIRPGDSVFDIFGGTHPLVSVRSIRKGRAVSVKRADVPYRDQWAADATVTIIRGGVEGHLVTVCGECGSITATADLASARL